MCRIEDFLGRAESFEKSLKKNSEGETDEGDLHLNVQQIFITFHQIFSIRICIEIFILQYPLFKDKKFKFHNFWRGQDSIEEIEICIASFYF